MAEVVFDHVTRIYPGNDKPSVDDLNLDIKDGEFLVLVGPSGCGKSTTLRMLAGLEEVNKGRILIGGKDVTTMQPKDRDIAMVFQNYALYPHMTVADNMGFALKIAGTPKEEIRKRVEKAAEILDLTEYLDRKPKALSGGQRQRVAMGRAIVREPKVFLMDEPLSNLDAKLRVQTRTQIAALQRQLGVTTLYVTHDQTEALTMGDRIAVIKLGILQQVGAPTELYDRPANVFVAGFIGSPSMNINTHPVVKGKAKIGEDNTVTWLSRSDWNGTLPTETVKLALTEQLKKDLQDIRYDPADYEAVNLPAMGKNNGVTLYDMIGLDYDDPKWDDLLDNLTFDEMNTLIGDAFHWTMPVKSIEAPGTRDENGPQGLTASLLGSGATQLTATAFTSEDVMAATFNTDLMTAVGTIIGNNCLSANIACLYGPGNNIHRTPYGGRNFEYYSEDGFLSGMMSAYEVAAIQEKGVHVVMKHFALNDCEQDRIGLGVWINEQAAREVYLKAFQAPIEVGNGNGVMIAYTRWGAVWSGGNAGLVNGILRGEWGCDGMVITDNVLNVYVNGPDGVLAGVSIYDAMMPYVTDKLPEYKNDGVIVSAMREACHHNLYAIANSCGMNGVGANTTIKLTRPTVITMVIIITCAAAFFCLLGIVLWIFGVRKLRKTEEYKAYKGFLKDQKAAKKA